MNDPRPIYQQIAADLRDQILAGDLSPGDRVPSTNEISAYYSVNPTTSSKALNMLFEEQLLEKRRGLGMFVLPGAAELLAQSRRAHFAEKFLHPLLSEARALGLSKEDLLSLINHELQEASHD